MKYKRLTAEELAVLEQDFIHFLSSAQITGQDWEKMKKEESAKAEELIEVFSDVVYDKVLGKIQFLEFRDERTINIFHFGPDKIRLAGFRVKDNSKLDLTKENVLEQWKEHHGSVNVIKTEKEYSSGREIEIFEMLQSGCMITDDQLFKLLNEL